MMKPKKSKGEKPKKSIGSILGAAAKKASKQDIYSTPPKDEENLNDKEKSGKKFKKKGRGLGEIGEEKSQKGRGLGEIGEEKSQKGRGLGEIGEEKSQKKFKKQFKKQMRDFVKIGKKVSKSKNN